MSQTNPSSLPSSFKENLRFDLTAGLIVFLIALPLSVGIALASGAPSSAGIVAAVLGGIVGSLFTGSFVTISGPAAGLIVVVLGCIETMGEGDAVAGFRRALACFALAGVIQMILGRLKVGNLVFACAHSVVHGMLTAIGVIIMVKQMPVLFGVKPQAKSVFGILTELPQIVAHADLPIALIGLFSLFLLVSWAKFSPRKLKWLPGPLIVVALGIVLGEGLSLENAHQVHMMGADYAVGPNFLVAIPATFSSLFVTPDFSHLFTKKSLLATMSIVIVASLESMLSTYAVDRMDPYKRRSDLDRDLMSKGLVNLMGGLMGGLPVISEIVRSSANIASGARTRWANFFHGAWMLLFIACFPGVVHEIPLSALAAILIMVGYRLANPRQVVETYHHGWDELAIFLVTLLLTLATDLMIGIGAGVVVSLVTQVVRGVRWKEVFSPSIRQTDRSDWHEIHVEGSMGCVGLLSLRKHLAGVPHDKSVVVDLNELKWMDFTTRERLPMVVGGFSSEFRRVEIRWPDSVQTPENSA